MKILNVAQQQKLMIEPVEKDLLGKLRGGFTKLSPVAAGSRLYADAVTVSVAVAVDNCGCGCGCSDEAF